MKQTSNYNLPILEAGDKYLKDYHNDAFSAIDTELKAMNDKINTLDNADGSILEISQELENTNAEIIDARVGQTTLGDKIRNIDTQLDTIVHEIENKTDINDNSISTESVWSSSKTQTMIQQIPKGDKGEKGDSATATPLTNTVSSSDTSHAVTGKAVSDYVSSIIGDAINYINR